jgi:formylglycine-generating enzyme required for sulfatase activity
MPDGVVVAPSTPTRRIGGVELPIAATHAASGLALTLVPPGRFVMGSPTGEGEDDERPQVEVALARPFLLGTFPVTIRDWRRLDAARATAGRDGVTGFETDGIVEWRRDARATWSDPLPFLGFRPTDDHPVTQVSWFDAQEFCGRLGLRLPTEAEFEWALRGGTPTRYWWGDDPDGARGRGNYSDRSLRTRFRHWRVDGKLLDLPSFEHDDGFVFTSPVGTFAANPFGLHDVGGNVWEWCQDDYDAAAHARRDRDGHVAFRGDGARRVLRGASWDNGPRGARSARRYSEAPSLRLVNVGFRVALDLHGAPA